MSATETSNQECPPATEAPKKFPLYIVYSSWSLSRIEELFDDYDQHDGIGPMRIDRFRGEETNRTICLLKPELYQNLVAAGFTQRRYNFDFSIAEFKLREHNYPREGESRNLFVPLSHKLDANESRRQLENKLLELCKFGVLNEGDYKVTIRLTSRHENNHTGSAFLIFKREVHLDQIAVAKIVLHDTWWYDSSDESYELAQCFWAKEHKNANRPLPKAPTRPMIKSVPQPRKKVLTPSTPVTNAWAKPLVSKEKDV